MKLGNDALIAGYLSEAEKQFVNAIKELKKTGINDLRLAKARNSAANALLRDGKPTKMLPTFIIS
jgi:hypothetical protein